MNCVSTMSSRLVELAPRLAGFASLPLFCPRFLAMDSAAVFQNRLVQLRLEDAKAKFIELGWTTFGEFAFASAFVPGSPDDGSFDLQITRKLFGDAEHPKRVAVRRLFFEAYSMAVADVRRRVEKSDSDAPRRMPQPERNERLLQQKDKLSGLELTGPLECSDSLIDRAVAIYDNNELSYLSWDMLTSREDEQRSIKHLKDFRPDEQGYLREYRSTKSGPADTSSDLLLKWALMRRGLALDQAGVMSFKVHEEIVRLLIRELTRPPLPGFSKVSVEQLLRADQEIFNQLRDRTRNGVQMAGDMVKPVDAVVEKVLDMAVVRMLLLQPRGGSSGSGGGKRDRSPSYDGPAKKGKNKATNLRAAKRKLEAENEKLRAQASSQSRGWLKGCWQERR